MRGATQLDPVQQLEQARHDRMHPSQVCQRCPTELLHRERLNTPPSLFGRYGPGLVVLLVLIALFVLLSVLI